MNNEVSQIDLIKQSIYTVLLHDIDHEKIAYEVEKFGLPVGSDCEDYGYVSRGFVQHEDIICPVTTEFTKLESSVIEAVSRITGKDYEIDEMWAVNLVRNQSVIAHSHYKNSHIYPGEYYSIAYYPLAPSGSAELIFSASWCGHMHKTLAVKPEDGMMVVFNSFITHMTARQISENKRIVVSMNLSPVEPETKPNADWSAYKNRPLIAE